MNIHTKQLKKLTIPILALGLVIGGAGVASAHGIGGNMRGGGNKGAGGDPQAMFTTQASVLGVSVDEVKNAWAQGKDMKTLAKEKGINEATLHTKMNSVLESEMKTRLAGDVASGKITQAQADEMTAQRTKRETQMKQTLAQALGISALELDQYKAAGKTPEDIIKEKGLNATTVHQAINQAMQTQRIADESARVQELVTKGVLTQDQANKRIETIKTQTTKQGPLGMSGKGHGGVFGKHTKTK